jgi:hypothetical protein
MKSWERKLELQSNAKLHPTRAWHNWTVTSLLIDPWSRLEDEEISKPKRKRNKLRIQVDFAYYWIFRRSSAESHAFITLASYPIERKSWDLPVYKGLAIELQIDSPMVKPQRFYEVGTIRVKHSYSNPLSKANLVACAHILFWGYPFWNYHFS